MNDDIQKLLFGNNEFLIWVCAKYPKELKKYWKEYDAEKKLWDPDNE